MTSERDPAKDRLRNTKVSERRSERKSPNLLDPSVQIPFWFGVIAFAWCLLGGLGLTASFWYRDWTYLIDSLKMAVYASAIYGLTMIAVVAISCLCGRLRAVLRGVVGDE